jgi:hypothetical protein
MRKMRAMRIATTHFKTMQAALKELEPIAKNPARLASGRPWRRLEQRPRETLGNWLLCAVANFKRGREEVIFGDEKGGGDGVVFDGEGWGLFAEHVFVPRRMDGDEASLESLILKAVEHKAAKGAPYAKGKTLIVLSDATGRWFPNPATRRIARKHHFDAVWVMHLEKRTGAGRYQYVVVKLDLSKGDAPVWTVDIAADFKSWIVRRNRGGLVIPPLPGQGLVKAVRPGRSGMLLVPRGPRLWLPRW